MEKHEAHVASVVSHSHTHARDMNVYIIHIYYYHYMLASVQNTVYVLGDLLPLLPLSSPLHATPRHHSIEIMYIMIIIILHIHKELAFSYRYVVHNKYAARPLLLPMYMLFHTSTLIVYTKY